MAYEQRPGDIAIFKNDNKKSDKSPDYRLKGLDLNGEPIEAGLWIKDGRSGSKFMAGQMRLDEYTQRNTTRDVNQPGTQPSGSYTPPAQDAPIDKDDIPF